MKLQFNRLFISFCLPDCYVFFLFGHTLEITVFFLFRTALRTSVKQGLLFWKRVFVLFELQSQKRNVTLGEITLTSRCHGTFHIFMNSSFFQVVVESPA